MAMAHCPDFLMKKSFQEGELETSCTYSNEKVDSSDDWVSLFFSQSPVTEIQPLESDFMNLDSSLLQEFLFEENDVSRNTFENSFSKGSHYAASPIVTACHEQSPSNSLLVPFEHAHPFSAEMHFPSSQYQLPEAVSCSEPVSDSYPSAAFDHISPQNSILFSTSQSSSSLLGTFPPGNGSSKVEAPPFLGHFAEIPVSLNSFSSTQTKTIEASAPSSAASLNTGLAQSSIESTSHQKCWQDEEFDAMIFVDQTFTKDVFELEEEIATSTLEIREEKSESIHTFEQSTDDSMPSGTVLRNEQGEYKSNASYGMESMSAQVATAETTAKRKRLGKRKSSNIPLEDQQSDHSDTGKKSDNGEIEEDEEKRQARLMRNRESAQLSRQRKKVYVDELEEKLRTMTSTVAELNNTIRLISAENVSLRSQLGYFYQAHGPSAKPGVLPAGFPVLPVTPYTGFIGGRPILPGVRAPPVPIPRLKAQAPPKSSKTSKTSALKGTLGGRRKRLVGAAAMGFCLIMMIFAPLNSNFMGKEKEGNTSIIQSTRNQDIRIGGRVLMSSNQIESASSSPHWEWDALTGNMLGLERREVDTRDESASKGGGAHANVEGSENGRKPVMDCCTLIEEYRNHSAPYFHTDMFRHNVTEPLAASLFVPRNNKLVKIDGSLIIQAIMAGDKAAQSSMKEEPQKGHRADIEKVQTGAGQNLPAVTNLKVLEAVGGMALESSEDERSRLNSGLVIKNQKALISKPEVRYDATHLPDSDTSGSMQQWLLSDFAGTILSTGTCTEVFQFETSPVPGTRKANETTASYGKTRSQKRSQIANSLRSRRDIEDSVPLLPARQSTVGRNASGTFREEKLADPAKRVYRERGRQNERRRPSSMVVSVLSESHKSGDDVRQTPGGAKGTSNFFVVVLLDSVKYVTYSCMLPSQGPQPQLVTG
ncbi:hypothetical protein O6H91_12G003600 [Diphasiastrum complanatum]|uniref:Uncharacterized protein n=13 Tax=Diphasiastrum complanatum TaxID=34168 RepID=A0ACC2BYG6_DIPCM|nr:hypothetical protein O6H91_12G003600 [Diphasiastrum complanatum]KAJ7534783.1 hypothetical protein O6H91_12G003600 [Diphasiastrum complanatum]KAJ7534784.1 hypothetical protein O6H91_12G003600 [Diphasiastrum complanatum]KAJ7534785.1 hypothetical protein O6H91_12G003600 [Diphasiastrum complanatum]KAJ7534786.1 hypothetical protein O6H91_12G003600 [Diphasiastrum complanatum]